MPDLTPSRSVPSPQTALAPISSPETLSCSPEHAVSDRCDGCHTRRRRCARRVREAHADAPQLARRPSDVLGPVAPRRLRVLVAILRHGGHIARSAGWMDWGRSRAAMDVRRVLLQTLFLLLASRASTPAARQHAGTCWVRIWGAGGKLGAALLGSAGLCRQLHHAACTCTVRYGRTRQLRCHVADGFSHVAGSVWAIHTVSSLLASCSGHAVHAPGPALHSDASVEFGRGRRKTVVESSGYNSSPTRFRG